MAARKSRKKRSLFRILNSLSNLFLKINIAYVLGFLLIIASFLIGVLVTKVQYLENGAETTLSGSDQTLAGDTKPQTPTGPVDVSEGHLPILGKSDAKVTIVEFADFQCPFCEQLYTNAEKNIIKDYVDKGLAKFAFRHYAFLGQESTDAALASECANEQGKFWEYHNYLYEHQAGENQGAFAKDKLKGFAATLGLDSAKFNNCLDSNKYQKNIDQDLKEGGKVGVNGTPATFVNGILISGAAPYADFKTQIEKALK